MDEFLDDSIVLPPGDWGEDLLLPAMQERNVARRRKGILMDKLIHKIPPTTTPTTPAAAATTTTTTATTATPTTPASQTTPTIL